MSTAILALHIGRKQRACTALIHHYLCSDLHGRRRNYYNFETVARERQSNCTKIVQRQYVIRMQNKHLIDRSTQSVKIRICTIILRCPCSILAAVFLPLKIVRSSQQKCRSQESGLRRYAWRTASQFRTELVPHPYEKVILNSHTTSSIVNKWCKMDLGERPKIPCLFNIENFSLRTNEQTWSESEHSEFVPGLV